MTIGGWFTRRSAPYRTARTSRDRARQWPRPQPRPSAGVPTMRGQSETLLVVHRKAGRRTRGGSRSTRYEQADHQRLEAAFETSPSSRSSTCSCGRDAGSVAACRGQADPGRPDTSLRYATGTGTGSARLVTATAAAPSLGAGGVRGGPAPGMTPMRNLARPDQVRGITVRTRSTWTRNSCMKFRRKPAVSSSVTSPDSAYTSGRK